ncbi:MAG TPA: radical SAM protein [Actinobacteria bacterium]|nr:radical SAM protein [Actinomycetota bacterium]
MPARKLIPDLMAIDFLSTRRCNLKCKHCSVNAKFDEKIKVEKTEIDFDTFTRTVEDALPLGLKSVRITGGEPFLRSDIVDIISFLSEKTLNVSIETNATLINKQTAKALASIGSLSVGISLDGALSTTHDALRGVPGAYEATLEGIAHLQDSSVCFYIISCLHKKNLKEQPALAKLADGLGATRVKYNVVRPVGRALKFNERGHKVKVRHLQSAMRAQGWPKEKDLAAMEPAFVPISGLGSHLATSICKIGNRIGLLDDGSLGVCHLAFSHSGLTYGHINESGLRQTWLGSHPILEVIRTKIPNRLEGVCKICVLRKYCRGRCRAIAFLLSGSFLAADDRCQEAFDEGYFPKSRLITEV